MYKSIFDIQPQPTITRPVTIIDSNGDVQVIYIAW